MVLKVQKKKHIDFDLTQFGADEREEMSKMYEETLKNFTEGSIVPGKVLEVRSNEVLVDIGYKSEGVIDGHEFADIATVNVGDQFDVLLDQIEDDSGMVILSKEKAEQKIQWEKVLKSCEEGSTVMGIIRSRVKGGMIVDVAGVDSFLPGSQVDVSPVHNVDALVGNEFEFRVLKINEERRNIILSRRELIEERLRVKKRELLATIESGQGRKGMVKNITDFGVFIDLGGVDGLLHITDLSWGRVNHPSEVVKLDEELDVVILDFNENKDRISLGRKQLLPHPWANVEEKFPVGSTIKGKVVSLTDYGAFIELETGIEGLIHISEMSWSQHIKHPSQILNVGQEIEAKVLNIESEDKKISLGLKQLEPDPWENIEAKYPLDSHHNGIVRNLTQFGAFVELEEGIDGLVHISDLSWTKKVRHPSEVVKKGDEIEVVVLGINREERRIALGHKQVEANPWDTFEENYSVGTEVNVTIARIIDKGVIVTLPLGVDGFIPSNHLGHPRLKKATEYYKVDDEVPAKVIEFDKENKKIVMSISEFFKEKERGDWEEYMEKQGVEKETLEDLFKAQAEKKKGGSRKKKADEAEKPAEETAAAEETAEAPAAEAAPEAEEEKTDE